MPREGSCFRASTLLSLGTAAVTPRAPHVAAAPITRRKPDALNGVSARPCRRTLVPWLRSRLGRLPVPADLELLPSSARLEGLRSARARTWNRLDRPVRGRAAAADRSPRDPRRRRGLAPARQVRVGPIQGPVQG